MILSQVIFSTVFIVTNYQLISLICYFFRFCYMLILDKRDKKDKERERRETEGRDHEETDETEKRDHEETEETEKRDNEERDCEEPDNRDTEEPDNRTKDSSKNDSSKGKARKKKGKIFSTKEKLCVPGMSSFILLEI